MEKILILDFGSQYTQLIARRVRELNVYCEIHPFNKIPAIDASVRGVILSGSPFSVRDAQAPTPDLSAIKGKLPLLGVCYGAQYLAQHFGGEVTPAPSREYGRAMLTVVEPDDRLMEGLPRTTQVWMSHGDTITRVPDGYRIVASTAEVHVAAYRIEGEPTWAIQFHPEVYHSTDGVQLLRNFVGGICGCAQSWTSESFVETTVRELREKIGDDKVVLGLSGGVDSTVAAVLLHRAIGENLHCIFVDSGLLRKNEFESVLDSYKGMGLNVKGVKAGDKFLGDLAGVTDPEAKRKIIGRDFVEVFNEEAIQIKDVKWLAQGTIYPDVIESCSVNGPSATIKSHHNVGGLPEKMNLKIVEPLRLLFKDEVRRVGRSMGISEQLIGRHPFPGPGLAIRILGDITPEKVEILQNVDKIYIDSLRAAGLYDQVWQAGAVLLPVKSVGVMGDERTYESCVALRAVTSTDGMTADWLWTDSEGLVSGVALDTTSGDIFLTVGEGRGNALVALMQDGKVVWSWHVWVTDAPQTMTYGNGTVFMDRNLGAAGTTAGGTDAYGMYYQWGRKDPFYGGEKTETSANAFLEAKNGTVVNPAYPALDWAFSKSATTTDGAAANPMTFYNDKVGTGYNWLASPNATLWGEAKTLNDPCPPGYRVPETGAWEDLISGRQYIDGVSVWDGTNYGMTYTHGGQTAWYPAQGYRNYSSGAIVGLRSSTGGSGAYWSAETSSVKSYYLFFRSKLSSSGSINNELDMNRSYGYTVRCCKE